MTIVDTLKNILGGDPLDHADPDMRAVLNGLKTLHPRPIEDLDPIEARLQPTLADGVEQVMAQKALRPDRTSVTTRDLTIPGALGDNPARVYTPANVAPGTHLPAVLYFHGGGFVIADLDTYDASARALAQKANVIVVSAHYRQAPEHKFPAAHEDANVAWRWLLDNAVSLGGDPARLAVVGESAGGNLAANVAIAARDHGWQAPAFMGLIYPMANTNTMSLSYEENRNAQPLNKAMMLWFVKQSLPNDEAKKDLRLNLVDQALHNLPPARIVTAGIDPLRSDGENLAEALTQAGCQVTLRNYPGATHEFFGAGTVVQAARDAQDFIVEGLNTAFLTMGPLSNLANPSRETLSASSAKPLASSSFD